MSDDFTKIIMKKMIILKIGPHIKKTHAKILINKKKYEWIVFAHYKDLLGQVVYKFLGEFHTSFEESDNYQHTFIRKKTKIYFKDFILK